MVEVRIVERAAFCVAGRQVYISGPDSAQFGRFWAQCHADGCIDRLRRLPAPSVPQMEGALLGVSRVEADPARRDFFFLIGVEYDRDVPSDLTCIHIPAGRWAVFACPGAMPDALVAGEMYAFGEWLPASSYRHALAPEMEVYPPGAENYCEFWLPLV